MKRQLAKAVEIGVETVNYWIISYALSSMAMIFRAECEYSGLRDTSVRGFGNRHSGN